MEIWISLHICAYACMYHVSIRCDVNVNVYIVPHSLCIRIDIVFYCENHRNNFLNCLHSFSDLHSTELSKTAVENRFNNGLFSCIYFWLFRVHRSAFSFPIALSSGNGDMNTSFPLFQDPLHCSWRFKMVTSLSSSYCLQEVMKVCKSLFVSFALYYLFTEW